MQLASALRKEDEPASIPSGYQGRFRVDPTDELNQEIELAGTSVRLGNSGTTLQGTIVSIIQEAGGLTLEIEGTLTDGQDSESRQEIHDHWSLHVGVQDDQLTLDSAEGPGPVARDFSGQQYTRIAEETP